MDNEDQADESQVTDSTQAEETRVTETTEKSEAAISQREWQQAQEELRQLKQMQVQDALNRFETENPIVKTEKMKDKWEEVKKAKGTPGHRYAGLDYNELLNLIRDPNDSIVHEPKKPIMPSVRVAGGSTQASGEIDPQVNEWLSMRYSQKEIESTKR